MILPNPAENCQISVLGRAEPVRKRTEARDLLVVHVPDGQDKPYRANGRVYVPHSGSFG